jgi:hypothetical protein
MKNTFLHNYGGFIQNNGCYGKKMKNQIASSHQPTKYHTTQREDIFCSDHSKRIL